MSSDQEAQEDELMALQSIYDTYTLVVTDEGEIPGGQFSACLELPHPFEVKFCKPAQKENSDEQLHSIKHLPPIILNFSLPADYPSTSGPEFTVSCKWLTVEQLTIICRKLDSIWEENHGDVVLFMWMSFLNEEVLDHLKIESPLDLSNVVAKRPRVQRSENAQSGDMGSSEVNKQGQEDGAIKHDLDPSLTSDLSSTMCDPRAIQDIASQDLLLPTILEHNKNQEEHEFRTTLFTCQVCFMEKLGSLCTRFQNCDHVYCKECMTGYFDVQITEGAVKALTCPSDKCESQAHPSQVKELVTAELFARYERLLLQSSLDTMSDVIYCPLKHCGCAVLVDHDHNLGNCPACHFSFCIFCKLTYHGVSPCKIRSDEVIKLKKEWEAADEEKKIFLEKRYGKKIIRQVVEESYSLQWLEEFSKQCPKCKTNIQKIDGCNKMTCTKCHNYFCWLCMESLSKQNPYQHFNKINSACFNRLFHGVITDDGDDDEWFMPDEWLDQL